MGDDVSIEVDEKAGVEVMSLTIPDTEEKAVNCGLDVGASILEALKVVDDEGVGVAKLDACVIPCARAGILIKDDTKIRTTTCTSSFNSTIFHYSI